MPIDVAQLKDGDLLFPYSGTDLALPDHDTTHVVIMSGKDAGNHPTHIHQIEFSRASPFAGTFADRTVPNSSATPGKSLRRKRVMRCRNDNLRTAAAALAARWNEYFQLDFAADRRDNASMFEGGKSRTEVVEEHRRLFHTFGRFRAVKYAARRDGFLCYPSEDGGSGQGMFCSMFAVVCYQVAGITDLVTAADASDPRLRVTDKKLTPGELDHFEDFWQAERNGKVPWIDFELYKRYSSDLKETNPYRIAREFPDEKYKARKLKSHEYIPSMMYFNYNQIPSIEHVNWKARITEGMMVDSKIIMPRGLFASLKADPEGWRDMGDLVGVQHPEARGAVDQRRAAKSDEQAGRRRDWRRGRF